MKFKSALIATMAATTAVASIAPVNISADSISERESNFLNSYKEAVNIGGDITVKFNEEAVTVDGHSLPANTFVVSGTGTLEKNIFTCESSSGFLSKLR